MHTYSMAIHVPYDVLSNLHKSRAEAAQDIQHQAATRYYKNRVLSLGKAAELAGMTRLEFIDYLRFTGEYIFEYNGDELSEIQEEDVLKLEEILS